MVLSNPKERDNNNNYVFLIGVIPEDDYIGKKLKLLIGQYYYGIGAQNDLKNLLTEIGVEFDN